jgi:methionyl-tRNA synthetase
MFIQNYFGTHIVITAILLAWSMVWKGIALWKSAGFRQKWWFLIFLVVNTFGILEMVYIFIISRKYKIEVIEK